MNTLGILFLDSFRMLRSQKLFWIVLVLSGLVALVYASIGFNENGITALFGLLSIEHEMLRQGEEASRDLYLLMFTNAIVPFWLGLLAVILALISCASIFPEFVKDGSVDLFLSKPPSRLTLFLGKSLGSLMFVFLQVFPFSVIVFLTFGLRFGDWNFSIFWAVPLVVLVFSFVYAMHVLVSVWSGSVVFGLLAAFLIWGIAVMSEWAEFFAYQWAYTIPQAGMKLDMQGGWEEVDPRDDGGEVLVGIHWMINLMRTPLPKTRSTGNQMRRLIRVGSETDQLAGKSVIGTFVQSGGEEPPQHVVAAEQRADRRHPVWKDIGSSLGYELVVVGLAAFIFCRRDY